MAFTLPPAPWEHTDPPAPPRLCPGSHRLWAPTGGHSCQSRGWCCPSASAPNCPPPAAPQAGCLGALAGSSALCSASPARSLLRGGCTLQCRDEDGPRAQDQDPLPIVIRSGSFAPPLQPQGRSQLLALQVRSHAAGAEEEAMQAKPPCPPLACRGCSDVLPGQWSSDSITGSF